MGRRRVSSAQVESKPYGQIAQLIVRYGPGDEPRGFGSGFFIGEQCVATAAHVLMPLDGRRAVDVTVTPARQGNWAPKGHEVSSKWKVHTKWEGGGRSRPAYDFGCIFLVPPDERPNRTLIGELELAALSNTLLEDKSIMAAGFPKMSTADAHMYKNTSKIGRILWTRWLDYSMLTKNGESGSPLLMRRGGQYIVVGIHTMKLGGGTRMGLRVTPDVKKWFNARKNESSN